MNLAQLKKQAASLGCSVEDDKENTTLYIHADEDKAWEDGLLTSLVFPYGSGGSTMAEWRKAAIVEAAERLEEMGRPEFDAAEV